MPNFKFQDFCSVIQVPKTRHYICVLFLPKKKKAFGKEERRPGASSGASSSPNSEVLTASRYSDWLRAGRSWWPLVAYCIYQV